MTFEDEDPTGGDEPRPETTAATLRERMVAEQLVPRHIDDSRVLEVMGRLPRHRFLDDEALDLAYVDHPVAIGAGQTMSQPYVVALMTQALELCGDERVLEIGTGSGYQTAVLAELVGEVFTIEVVESLGAAARERLTRMGYDNVQYRIGDGRLGWPEAAPFDAVLVAAAPARVPDALLEQVADGGRLVIPVGPCEGQVLDLMWKDAGCEGGFRIENLGGVRFVPFV